MKPFIGGRGVGGEEILYDKGGRERGRDRMAGGRKKRGDRQKVEGEEVEKED